MKEVAFGICVLSQSRINLVHENLLICLYQAM